MKTMDISKNIEMNLDRRPYISIYIRQLYITHRIINIIPGMDRSIANPTPVAKTPLEKIEVDQSRKNDFN